MRSLFLCALRRLRCRRALVTPAQSQRRDDSQQCPSDYGGYCIIRQHAAHAQGRDNSAGNGKDQGHPPALEEQIGEEEENDAIANADGEGRYESSPEPKGRGYSGDSQYINEEKEEVGEETEQAFAAALAQAPQCRSQRQSQYSYHHPGHSAGQ